MPIILNNSLKRNKELFEPLDKNNVRMYVCGPTVYDRAHIGNARAVVVFDVLYRVLRHEYGAEHITYARNITDVDDKINAAAKAQGIDISDLTTKTTEMFHTDMAALNCLSPTHEPRATAHIPEMLEMIDRLIENGNAYAAEGHVLFRVSSDAKYGHLSGRSVDEMVAGSRVEVAPYKENPMDFVLWKPSAADEPGWESKYGRGRPGWHIECSAMSIKYLGQTFDIHGGGADLTFPHHENEIAQSCCAYPGSEYARYWVHNGFLSVNGEKMSKSLGNFVTVKDLLDKGVKGEVIRYALLSSHYKNPLDWTEKLLNESKETLDSFYRVLKDFKDNSTLEEWGENNGKKFVDAYLVSDFSSDLNDDMNVSKVREALNNYANAANVWHSKGNADMANDNRFRLKKLGNFIGILEQNPSEWFQGNAADSLKQKVEPLIEARKAARAAKNWAESDRIRDELLAMGIIVEDKAGGMEWRVK